MKLQDCLHYYMGCKFITDNSEGEVNPETLRFIYPMIEKGYNVQLVLRKLEDLTDEELKGLIIKLSRFNLSECEFEFDQYWVNAFKDGKLID